MNARPKLEILEERLVPANLFLKFDSKVVVEVCQVQDQGAVNTQAADSLSAPTPPPQPGGRTVCNDNVCYYVVTLDPAS